MAGRGRSERAAVHARLAREVRELWDRLGGLPRVAEFEAVWKDIWVHEVHNSTAIEGNTLVLREVQKLLAEKRAVGDKELKDYLEVKGYADAAEWVYGQAAGAGAYETTDLLTLAEVRHVHRLAMTPVWDVAPHPHAQDTESPGNWRRHDIRPFAAGMQPPPHTEVPARMRDWVDEVCRLSAVQAPIGEAIAQMHAGFERTHPFLDGNGRTGRLLSNLVLVRLRYPPAIIQKRERAQYLAALGRADAGDYGPLGEVFARAILDNLLRFVVPAVAGPARLVSLESLATKEISAGALRVAAYRGRLRAIRGDDRVWRSTRKWVDEYLAERFAALREPRRARAVPRDTAAPRLRLSVADPADAPQQPWIEAWPHLEVSNIGQPKAQRTLPAQDILASLIVRGNAGSLNLVWSSPGYAFPQRARTVHRNRPERIPLVLRTRQDGALFGSPVRAGVCYITEEQLLMQRNPGHVLAPGTYVLDVVLEHEGAVAASGTFELVVTEPGSGQPLSIAALARDLHAGSSRTGRPAR
jgi:Fic family protein